MSKQVLIEKYKGVLINYDKDNGRLYFEFEGDREVKYLFEAHQIIDEPNWETCELKGFIIDGTFNDYIGLAKAEKKDTKSGKPYWLIKGRYDMQYKEPSNWQEVLVYPDTPGNREVYKRWQAQAEVVREQENKLTSIIKELGEQ